ncbi:SDH family Clp fold serine proteinase [Candidatus Poriferisodalis sp.]|uniref:SDH family Clp fold serine proteinase n=1 Tax=Candidatus Poriferisodalis sp. TaxID=3101277 RepID=UPI003B01F5D9
MTTTPTVPLPPTTQDSAREWATNRLIAIEDMLDADGLTIISPMQHGVEHRAKIAIEARHDRRDNLFVIVDTPGGVVEVVERIVRVFREHYREVQFIVPDRAMSAGTVLVMSGDHILMDYHSCLGPIDPQLVLDDRLVPALSYLAQYEHLIEKSENGSLSTAELVLLQKLDLAELHQFQLARDLSIELLKQWLTSYKFKDWTTTETRGIPVTKEMKEDRASDIARKLSDQTRWLTHGRGIDMNTLRDELHLKIDDLNEQPDLKQAVWNYFWFIRDHMVGNGSDSFVHAINFF